MGDVIIETSTARTLAVMRDRAYIPELAQKVPALCGKVWDFIKRHGLKGGRMIALYRFDPSGSSGDAAMALEVGAEVEAAFEGAEGVACTQLPAGTAATLVHVGPYHQLSRTHDRIQAFCRQNGRQMAGVCWEFYGHWTADESNLRTDVSYLLR